MRLFVAIEVDDAIKRKMLRVQQRLSSGAAHVRWCSAEQLHLTLKFIGEVADDKLASIGEALERVAAATPPFELEISGTGCFPPSGQVRIVWIGGAERSGTLRRAFDSLETELAALGIPRENRTFSEHFTIARVKSDPSRGKLRQAVQATAFEPCRQEVTELVLFQSTLSPGGAHYTPLTRAVFSG